MLETVLTGLSDSFPKALRKRKTLFTAVACAFLFVVSFIFTTRVCVTSLLCFFFARAHHSRELYSARSIGDRSLRAGGHLLLADHRLVRVQHHSDYARTARVRGVRVRVRRAAHQRERPRDVRPRARPLLEGLLARVHTARAPRVFLLFVFSPFNSFTYQFIR